MKLFRRHKLWWSLLLTFTVAVSLVTSNNPDIIDLFFSIAGHIAFATVASLLPLIFYWVIKNPMTTDEYMSTLTVAWLILAIANLSVM